MLFKSIIVIKTGILLILTFAFCPCHSQSTSTLIGGRAAGLGYASSTIVDEWSLFNNVAGLGKATQPSSAFACEIRPALIGASRIAALFTLPSKAGTWGAGIFRFGDNAYSEQLVTAAFANTIGNTSLGIRANYIQYRAEGFGIATAVSIDFGGITQISPQISIGAYINNLAQSKLSGTDNERLPTILVIGAGIKLSEKVFLTTEVAKDLAYQVAWRNGVEYSIYKRVFARTGFSMNPNAGYAGLGFLKRNLKMDFAIQFNPSIGTGFQASATYLFPTKTKK